MKKFSGMVWSGRATEGGTLKLLATELICHPGSGGILEPPCSAVASVPLQSHLITSHLTMEK